MRTATLTITQTGPECARYALQDGTGREIWSNRVYDTPAGHAGARARLASWAVKHQVRVIEHTVRARVSA